MARAIPALLRRIPVNDAAEVRARGGMRVDLPALVTADGELAQADPENTSFARIEIVGRLDFTRQQYSAKFFTAVRSPDNRTILRRPVGAAAREGLHPALFGGEESSCSRRALFRESSHRRPAAARPS
jgi:hypothetical protein